MRADSKKCFIHGTPQQISSIIFYFSCFLSHSYRQQSEFHLLASAHMLPQKQKGTASSWDLSAGHFGSGVSPDEVSLCRKDIKHDLCEKSLRRVECQILVSALLHLEWFSTCFVVQSSCCSVLSSSLIRKSRVILTCAGATECFITEIPANLWGLEDGCTGYWSI